MIEYIQLRNFQSHKDSELEFSPGVNVIIGDSDQGKTAIMRAFYWLIFGKPSGDSMRKWNTKADTEVTVETAEHQISRIRGKSVNQYIVDNDSYTGFGQSVPEPVSTILNVNEINFMRQLDPPFLFSKTAGEVAQYLNRLINLDVIDSSLSNIKRMHSQAEQSANSHLAEAQRIQHTLDGYSWTEEAEVDITKLEKKEARLARLKKAAEELGGILELLDACSVAVKKFAHTEALGKRIDLLVAASKEIQYKELKGVGLRNVLSQAVNTKAALAKLPATKGAEKAIAALEQRAAKQGTAQAAYNVLEIALTDMWHYAENKQKVLADYTRSVALLNKHMPDTCPLCEQPIRRK